MRLPFSHDAFLDVFGAYNTVLWPAVLLFWVATAQVAWAWFRGRGIGRRLLFGLLAAHWSWSGVAYHWLFFRRINPAASLFAALFILEALLFVWPSAKANASAEPPAGLRGVIGGTFVVYGLIYPLIGVATGLEYPRLPLFAVPCPTTLITVGMLVALPGIPRAAALIPVVWAIVGSSAAFALGITADMALVLAAMALGLNTVAPSVLGRRAAA